MNKNLKLMINACLIVIIILVTFAFLYIMSYSPGNGYNRHPDVGWKKAENPLKAAIMKSVTSSG